jgi:hypothetical protein
MARPAVQSTEHRPASANADTSIDLLVERIRAEYIEQPGLRLTEAQASRLWRLDEQQCRHCLSELTGADFLKRSEDGRYARPSSR